MDIRLALAAGTDIPIEELQIQIHQPTIKEISYIGEEGFFIAVQYLSLEKTAFIKDESLLASINNFQVFMTVMQNEDTKEIKHYITDLLTIIFPQYKALFMPKTLILSHQESNVTVTIDESNFDILQTVIRKIFCVNSAFGGQSNFNPQGKKAQEIAEKLMRGRRRLAEEKGEESGSVFGRYASILTVGLQSMSYQDCLNLTVYQLYDLIERYGLYVNWDIDIRSRLAGGKPDTKPDDWMKDIH